MKKCIYIVCILISWLVFFVSAQRPYQASRDWSILISDSLVIESDVIESKLFNFREEMAPVLNTVTGMYGFVSASGDMVIPCIYQFARDFHHKRAAVQNARTKKWGYIDWKNELVIPFMYDSVSDFGFDKEGRSAFILRSVELAYVKIGITAIDEKWGLINKDGEIILPIKYGAISPIIDNMACIVDGEFTKRLLPNGKYSWETNGKIGFINMKGEIVIPTEYDYDSEACYDEGYVTLKKDGITYNFNMKGEIVDE